MYHHYTFDTVNDALPALCTDLLHGGLQVSSRVGETYELAQVGITLLEPLRREILIPERKANVVAQIAETAWVLAGRNDIEWLSHYLPRAADFSDDGKTWRASYGDRLRHWGYNGTVDQLANVVALLRKDPTTRQAVISLWEPYSDGNPDLETKDRPCNDWLHFLARDGELDLHIATRSNDLIWGWSGINQFEWSVLLEVVAGLTGLKPGALHFSISSLHLYEHHWERARQIASPASSRYQAVELSTRFQMPRLNNTLKGFDALLERWFQLEYDIRTHSPMVPGYIDSFPEPMLRSWLHVLNWWWNGQNRTIATASALGLAVVTGTKPPWAQKVEIRDELGTVLRTEESPTTQPSPFLQAAIALHNEKHAAYGDSWKRRGEYMILANIARKVDRLGGGETSDETQADTAMDLMIYLAKYRTWLDDSDDPSQANDLLVGVEGNGGPTSNEDGAKILEEMLRDDFDQLEELFRSAEAKTHLVAKMLRYAYRLARFRWEKTQDDYRGADSD